MPGSFAGRRRGLLRMTSVDQRAEFFNSQAPEMWREHELSQLRGRESRR